MKREILTEDQAVQNLAYPIEVKVYEAGIQLVPSSAAITIYDPDGNAIVTSVSMTVAAGGTMTYSLSSIYTATLWENAVIEIVYIISSVDYKTVFFFDVVLNALHINVIDDDLKVYSPQIASEIWSTQTNYESQIEEAFKTVRRAIKDKGRRPHMLIDGSQVRELIIYKTFSLICLDFAKSKDDIWYERYLKYEEQYKAQFEKLVIKYDEDEDGFISENEKGNTLGQISLQR